MKKSLSLVSTSLIVIMTITGCGSSGENAMLGAGVGAAIASIAGESPLRGAAIGAATGYAAGRVIREQRRRDYDDRYDRDRYYEGRYSSRSSRHRYPVGRRTRARGIVISPYAPHHEIDVRGIPSGARVVDPSCDRVFINP
jgi:hypothetical protein